MKETNKGRLEGFLVEAIGYADDIKSALRGEAGWPNDREYLWVKVNNFRGFMEEFLSELRGSK